MSRSLALWMLALAGVTYVAGRVCAGLCGIHG